MPGLPFADGSLPYRFDDYIEMPKAVAEAKDRGPDSVGLGDRASPNCGSPFEVKVFDEAVRLLFGGPNGLHERLEDEHRVVIAVQYDHSAKNLSHVLLPVLFEGRSEKNIGFGVRDLSPRKPHRDFRACREA